MRELPTAIIGPYGLLRAETASAIYRADFNVVLEAENPDSVPASTWANLSSPTLFVVVGAGDREAASIAGDVSDLRRRSPRSVIVVLIAAPRTEQGALFDAGVDGCLPLSISPDALVMALDLLVAKQVASSKERPRPAIPTTACAPVEIPHDPCALSKRESEVLDALVQGGSNKHIARRLAISEATVKNHVRLILRKTGSGNRTQAAIWAMSQREESTANVLSVRLGA